MHAISVQRTAAPLSLAASDSQRAGEGVDYERVDPTTCRLIHALFPPHTCGFAFFLGLLANAMVKQYALSGLPESVRGDAAIVNVTNGYVGLSQRLHLSYDTTHMYLLIYRALGLLYVEKQGKQTTIIIPLDAYQPPARLVEILAQLKEHYRTRRPRVRRLIDQIAQRMALLLQAEGEQSIPGPVPPVQSELLARVGRVLRAQGVADPDGHIAMSIATEITPLVLSQAEEVVPLQAEQEVKAYLPRCYQRSNPLCVTLSQESSTAGERQDAENRPKSVPATQQAGNNTYWAATLARFSAPDPTASFPRGEHNPGRILAAPVSAVQQDRFKAMNLSIDLQTEEGTGVTRTGRGGFSVSNLATSQQTGEPFQAAPRQADANLLMRVDSPKNLPYNGIGDGRKKQEKIILPESFPDPDPALPRAWDDDAPSQSGGPLPQADAPVRQQARVLARLIEGKEENIGAYIILLRKHDPHTLRAAVIATLQRKHFPLGKGGLKKPGGYFTRRVQQFQQAIPEQIMALVQVYAQTSYEGIDAAMATQARIQAPRGFPPAAPARVVRQKRGTPMDQATAEALARRIPLEDPYVQVRGVSQVQEGSYVVEVLIDPVVYRFSSIETWETYHAQMQELEQEGETR